MIITCFFALVNVENAGDSSKEFGGSFLFFVTILFSVMDCDLTHVLLIYSGLRLSLTDQYVENSGGSRREFGGSLFSFVLVS